MIFRFDSQKGTSLFLKNKHYTFKTDFWPKYGLIFEILQITISYIHHAVKYIFYNF